MVNTAIPVWFKTQLSLVHNILEHKYYLDWFNEHVLARGARILGGLLWKTGDQRIIDGWVVNGTWRLMGRLSVLIRPLQSGFLYHYALVMILGVFLLMSWFVWIKPSL